MIDELFVFMNCYRNLFIFTEGNGSLERGLFSQGVHSLGKRNGVLLAVAKAFAENWTVDSTLYHAKVNPGMEGKKEGKKMYDCL